MKSNSPELELKAVASICRSEEKLGLLLLSTLEQEDFKYSVAAAAFKRLRYLYRTKGLIPDYTELVNDPSIKDDHRKILKGTKARVRTKERAGHLIDKLKEYTAARSIVSIAGRTLEAITENEEPDIAATIDALTNDIASLRMTGGLNKFDIVDYGITNSMKQLTAKKIKGESKRLIPTGIKQFDRVNGGITEDSLMLLGGDTGLGKTTIANNMRNRMAARGYKVGFVSLEMGNDEMHELILSNISGVDAATIVQHDPQNKRRTTNNVVLSSDDVQKIREAEANFVKKLETSGGSIVNIAPQDGILLEELLMVAKPFGFQVLFIDYLSLLKGVDGDRQWQLLMDKTKELKWWARKNNCAVIALIQTKDGEARLSTNMVNDANYAWFFSKEVDGNGDPILKCEQKKARKARSFTMYFKENFAKASIEEMFNYAEDPRENKPEYGKESSGKRTTSESKRSSFTSSSKGAKSRPAKDIEEEEYERPSRRETRK